MTYVKCPGCGFKVSDDFTLGDGSHPKRCPNCAGPLRLYQDGWGIGPIEVRAGELNAPDEPGLDVSDSVAHPAHYNKGKIEVIEFIEDQRLWFHLGNAVKYIARSAHKGKPVEDLRKAIWYIEREIELIQAEKEQREPCRPNDMGKK